MTSAVWFDRIPIWIQYFGWFAVALMSTAIGLGFGLWCYKRTKVARTGPVSTIVTALLALLAFVLAITFDMAATRFFARRQILIDEVNAIETTFLRAGFIVEPYRNQCRSLLRQYVDLRASLSPDTHSIQKAVSESDKIQSRLWNNAIGLAVSRSNPMMDALFIESLNKLIDIHTVRVVTALQYRIPLRIWVILFLLTVCTMTVVGYEFGISGVNTYVYIAFCILAVGFSLMIVLIADLDQSTRGSFYMVSQQPMIELRERMKAESTPEELSEHKSPEDKPLGLAGGNRNPRQ